MLGLLVYMYEVPAGGRGEGHFILPRFTPATQARAGFGGREIESGACKFFKISCFAKPAHRVNKTCRFV